MIIEDSFRDFLGIKVVEVGEFYSVLEGFVKEEFLNKMKTAHGGFISALIDSAMGVAANWDGNLRFAIQLSVNFVSYGKSGEKLKAISKRVGGGKSIVFMETVVYGEDGRVVAFSSGIVYGKNISSGKHK